MLTVIVAVRSAGGFFVGRYEMVPSPVPLPLVIVSHDALLVAVQEQAADADTLNVPPLLFESMVCDGGVTTTVHWAPAAACVTTTDWPATVSVAVRDEDDVFGAAATANEPSPVPVAPCVIVSQLTGLVAVQLHVAVVTPTEPMNVAPDPGTDCVAGATMKVHELVPAWVTVTV